MSWNYTPAPVSLIHPAGTVPPRPLQAGDSIRWNDGSTSAVMAAAPSLLQLSRAGSVRNMHRAPLQGDTSGCLTEVTAPAPAYRVGQTVKLLDTHPGDGGWSTAYVESIHGSTYAVRVQGHSLYYVPAGKLEPLQAATS